MRKSLYIVLLYILALIQSISIICLASRVNKLENSKKTELVIQPQMCDYLIECNAENMIKACNHYEILYPEIVTAQAILESGNFKSKLFRERNNPFGLYDSKNKEYFYFNHWTDALLAYKFKVQNKYKEGNYYLFLKELPYAMDKDYISKVKNIEKRLK